ncbi:MAG: type II toxin-antitoxin system VapC family toxin [Bacteroidales bacterium]|nr:type II toxin-antitoxin system VapC family toxin [Bacteroidales bacterium]
MMDSNRIFVDTNVLVGAWSGKSVGERCLRYLFTLKGKRLYISTLSIAQFVSVFQKKRTADEIRAQVKYLQTKFNLVGFIEKDVNEAIAETSPDIEDSIQYTLSRKVKCQHFVTNNIKDYTGFFLLNVLKPSQIRQINQ